MCIDGIPASHSYAENMLLAVAGISIAVAKEMSSLPATVHGDEATVCIIEPPNATLRAHTQECNVTEHTHHVLKQQLW